MKNFRIMIGSYYDGFDEGLPQAIRDIFITAEDCQEAKIAGLHLVETGHPFMYEKIIDIQEQKK
jgi:hypothetical protein